MSMMTTADMQTIASGTDYFYLTLLNDPAEDRAAMLKEIRKQYDIFINDGLTALWHAAVLEAADDYAYANPKLPF